MAFPDFSDLLSRVRDLLGESSAGFYTDAEIKRWLNDGETDVAIKSLCIESVESKTATINARTVATDYVKVHAVEYVPASGDPRGLIKITPLHVGHYFDSGTEPQAWFPWGQTVGIEPIPIAEYPLNVYCSSIPSARMSNDTDEPKVPLAFVPFIVQFAYIRGLYKDRLFGVAAAEYKSYIANLQVMRDSIIKKYAELYESALTPVKVVEI